MKKLAIPFLMLLSSVGLPVLGSLVAPATAAAQDCYGQRRGVEVVRPEYGYAPPVYTPPVYAPPVYAPPVVVRHDGFDRGRGWDRGGERRGFEHAGRFGR